MGTFEKFGWFVQFFSVSVLASVCRLHFDEQRITIMQNRFKYPCLHYVNGLIILNLIFYLMNFNVEL